MIADFFNVTFFQLLAVTIIGVLFGIPVALQINRYVEQSSEKERKKKILLVLRNELGANKTLIGDWRKGVRTTLDLLLPPKLRYESWKAFSDGGELQWIKDPELLGIISETYYTIRLLSDLAEKNFQWNYTHQLTQDTKGDLQNEVNKQEENTYNKIIEALDKLKDQLGQT